MKKLTVALALAATLTACTPEATEPDNTAPTPSPQPSPSFTQAMSVDQQAAFDALNHYFHTLARVKSDPEQDPEQLWDLYHNFDLALEERQWINLYRAKGIVQTGAVRYHYREVGEPVETEEGLTVQIQVCGDYHDWDLIDANGETVVSEEDTRYTEWSYDMIRRNERWFILGRVGDRAQRC